MFCYSKELTEYDGIMFTVLPFEYNNEWYISCQPPLEHEPYFIIQNGGYSSHTKKARISIKEPKYIHCSDDPMEEWILNDEEKIKLIELLNLPCKKVYSYEKSELTLWEFMLAEYEYNSESKIARYRKVLGLPMPDYTQLK